MDCGMKRGPQRAYGLDGRGNLCGATALDAGERYVWSRGGGCGKVRRAGGLREPPAAGSARQAAVLFLHRFGRRIEPAKYLIYRFAGVQVALRKPALTIVRTAAVMAAPVDVGDRVGKQREIRDRSVLAIAGWLPCARSSGARRYYMAYQPGAQGELAPRAALIRTLCGGR